MVRNRTEPHLVQFLCEEDIEIVKGRIPEEARARLRDVFLRNNSRGVRRLGAVRTRGRRDIEIFSYLPPRVSLRGYIYKRQSPREFGAPSRGQWPPWAVRRYLLYDVFLHELGHLQLVDPETNKWKRRYASESLAEEFADRWRRKLFAEAFVHPDPVHFPPTEGELEFIKVWKSLDKPARFRLVVLALKAPYVEPQDVQFLGTLTHAQGRFLEAALYQEPAVGALKLSSRGNPPVSLRKRSDDRPAILPGDRKLLAQLRKADDEGQVALTRYLCEKVLQRYPNHGRTLLRYASCLTLLALYDQAMVVLDRAEAVFPKSRLQYVFAKRGRLLEQMGDYAGSEQQHLRAHALDPDDAGFLIYAASVVFRSGDIRRAEDLVRKALLCPRGCRDEALFNLGGYLLAQKRYEEARDCYLRALEIDPDYEIAKTRLVDVERILNDEGVTEP